MSTILKDGTGEGYTARIDNKNRMRVKATVASLQHVISEDEEEAFQVSADLAIAASEKNLLLIKNTHETKNMVITFIRVQAAGAAAADENAYFNVKIGGDYSSGGTALTPANMFVGSAISASGLFYDGSGSAIVTSGTFTQMDRTYKTDDSYSKNGSLILPKNSSLLISHKGSTAAGQAYCRVSFYYDAD